MKIAQTWQWLGYLGLLPFVFFLSFSDTTLKVSSYNLPYDSKHAFVFYSAIILSFLAGNLWTKDTKKDQTALPLISNIFCLYAFICLLSPLFLALILLGLGYLSIFLLEYILCKGNESSYSVSYFTMRLLLTFIVCLLHCYALFSWF
jgi:hypothetical protein